MDQEAPIAQAELAVPQRLLAKVRYWLASIEGVEPGDEITANMLADKGNDGSRESRNFLYKAAEEALSKALRVFQGDGSEAFKFFGRRVELPLEDRGLIILTNLISTHIFDGNNWPKAAILLAGSQQGIELQDVINRLSKGMKGLLGLFSSLSIQMTAEDVEGTEGDITTYCEGIQQLWGDSPQTLATNKAALEQELVDHLSRRIVGSQPRYILELQRNLKYLASVAEGSLAEAVANATSRLEHMLAEVPNLLEGSSIPLSPLGRILAFNHARDNIQLPEHLQSREEVIRQTIEAASGLQTIDYHALASNNEVMLDQVRRRLTILRNVRTLISGRDDAFYQLARQRQKEVKHALKSRTTRRSIYDIRVIGIATQLSIYSQLYTSGAITEPQYQTAMEGECYAAAYAILMEFEEDWREARNMAENALDSIQAASRHAFHLEGRLEEDPIALHMLGIKAPSAPDQLMLITQYTVDILSRTLEQTPDIYSLSHRLSDYLAYTFRGEIGENDQYIKQTQQDLILLIKMILNQTEI